MARLIKCWMLRRFAPLHDVKIDFATTAEQFQTRHSERSEESRKNN
ncbi:MAG: hypothetical protein IJW31_09595 [Lentisphaeria bacterium]|nr:hypothetical protein [Lentisphaeria bacterium]